MLNEVKKALGITSGVFDSEITNAIQAALADLLIVDITETSAVETDPLIKQAVISYCGYSHNLNHGNLDLSERYEKAYEKQKATFITSSKYTEWING